VNLGVSPAGGETCIRRYRTISTLAYMNTKRIQMRNVYVYSGSIHVCISPTSDNGHLGPSIA
jgi:hypothetical protein